MIAKKRGAPGRATLREQRWWIALALLAPLIWLLSAANGAPTWLSALLVIPALVSVAALFILAYMAASMAVDWLLARLNDWLGYGARKRAEMGTWEIPNDERRFRHRRELAAAVLLLLAFAAYAAWQFHRA
jgi:hypothetical protein